MQRHFTFTIALAAILSLLSGCQNKKEMELKSILTDLQSTVEPVSKSAAEAYWRGTLSGTEADFDLYAQETRRLTAIFSDRATFEKLKEIKQSGTITDPLLSRQLDVVYDAFLANQVDTTLLNAVTDRESQLEQKYAAYRAVYKGEPINDNRVEEILRTSTDNAELQAVWEAHKGIGPLVADDIIEIVKLRNKIAHSLGFDNYHTMSLELSEQDPTEISALFDELDMMTQGCFADLKDQMDETFAARYGVSKQELMPWHFQGRYFQEAPNLYPVDLDGYYTGRNLEELTQNFYSGIGLDVSSIMAASDLYPKEGKNQHAFCTDINSNGDIRVLCNISDNEQWMGTMLHEFGHAVYAQGHDRPENPYFLRQAAHTFTTEAVAMMFGRLSRNPEWMQHSLGLDDSEKNSIAENCRLASRLQQLVFSRWVQVVYRFEKAMYADPDQDLNALWWNLVEKYQLLRKPEGRNQPDWATKIHIALYPCYYHNYQLGELFASQMHYYITKNVVGNENYTGECYIGNPAVGKWLQENIFNPGMRYPWNEMIERATGEKLTAKYYRMQFAE